MPMKVKNMKGIDLFCASPASTAICSSTDHHSMVRNGSKPLHHHRLRDHYKAFSSNMNDLNHSNYSSPNSRLAPCISELPFTPRLSSLRRKSSAEVSDLRRDKFVHGKSNVNSPPRGHSSRYLLSDSPFLDSLSESERYTTSNKSLALVPSTPVRGVRSEERELTKSRSTGAACLGSFLMDAEKENAKKKMVKSYSNRQAERNTSYGTDYGQKSVGQQCHSNSTVVKSSSSASSRDQVVVLRVSLHCKGCAGKLRKYLSKMEGQPS
uniref:HMA domain-containing protein n=1 Tax=Opuntia streptacantha TaxID=393608 RepID=A0A7C8ZMF0_OPUST